MLSPKRTKYRKMQTGRRRGLAYRGSDVSFGDFGLQALGVGYLSARQIEAARMAITRHVKREGTLWIRIFPDRPITRKPLEVRMGGGKGAPDEWVAVIKPGRMLYRDFGRYGRASARSVSARRSQTPSSLQVCCAWRDRMKAKDLRDRSTEDLRDMDERLCADLFQYRFKNYTDRLDDTSLIRKTRRDVARVRTILAERERSASSETR